VRIFYLSLFYLELRVPGVSLEFPGLENIPEVPGNPAEVGPNNDGRKAVSATLSVLT